MDGAAIPVQQKARQRRGDHDRVAHNDVAIGAADLVLAPGDRHHAHRPGEIGNVEGDLGVAVAADGDDAGVKRQRGLRRRAALQLRPFVAAAADLAARALHAVDQLVVEIADVGRQPALTEEVIVRRRRLVVGEIEDADVDRGDDDARLFARGKAVKFDGHAQRGVRPDQRRHFHFERQSFRLAVDREPLHADGAAGHALRHRIERPAQGGDDIGAVAPVAADRHLQLGEARLHVRGLRRDQAIADNIERDAAGGARGDRNGHRVARLVLALVERNFQHVRRIGAGVSVPAGVELDRRDGAVAVAGRDFEPVAAPLHRHGDMPRPVERGVDRAVGDAARLLDRLVIPRAVALVILIMRLDAHEFVVQPALRHGRAIGRDHNHVEIRAVAFTERAAGEQRLDADHVAARGHRQRDGALDRASARFRHAHDHLGIERVAR